MRQTAMRTSPLSSISSQSYFLDDSSIPEAVNFQGEDSLDDVVPYSALPGLNMAVNMATLTHTEREMFRELAPVYLQDCNTLMEAVSTQRDQMLAFSQDRTRVEGLRNKQETQFTPRGNYQPAHRKLSNASVQSNSCNERLILTDGRLMSCEFPDLAPLLGFVADDDL